MKHSNNIRKIREKHGFSKEQFASSINKAPSYIDDIENGLVNPTIDEIKTLASVVGVSCSDFLGV